MELIWNETLTEAQVEAVHALFQKQWWSRHRTLTEVRQMVAQPQLIVASSDAQTGKLLGFGRVIGDFVFKALILDIMIDEAFQRQGLGTCLMQFILAHPKLKQTQHIELYCKHDMGPYYEKFGFTKELGPVQLMRKSLPGTEV